jgi:hypothetical protein
VGGTNDLSYKMEEFVIVHQWQLRKLNDFIVLLLVDPRVNLRWDCASMLLWAITPGASLPRYKALAFHFWVSWHHHQHVWYLED